MQKWIDFEGARVQHQAFCAPPTFTTERRWTFEHGGIEIRDYRSTEPTDDVWEMNLHFLDFSLTPRPKPAWANYGAGARRTSMELGRVMFVPAGRRVRSGTGSGVQRSMTCAFGDGLFDEMLDEAPEWNDLTLGDSLRLGASDIDWLLLKIYREMQRPGLAGPAMMDSLVHTLAILLLRRFTRERDETETIHAGGLSPWRLRRIRDRVHADSAPPDLRELAALCDVSVRHLTRGFKVETGQTVAAYVQEVMLDRALRLLAESDFSIAEVAGRLGFSNATSFSTAFRRATGQRPSEVEGRPRFRAR